ncbi:MAG TPA: hypothetical protein VH601_17695 [Bryobacteraceae bacterium]
MRQKICLFLFAVGMLVPATKADDLGPEDKGVPVVITGWLRDAACLMRYKQVTKPLNDCAKMCALAGAPLVIATQDGKLFTPISTSIPETDQRRVLMPHVGKYVRVSGRLFDRAGMHAIAVERMEDVQEPN